MKQKRKMGRKLIGFLLTLVMVIGLMPGMSMTAYAADAVAKVGETEYATLSEALTAWTDGSTLTLLADVETASTIIVSATKILDLNGHNITMTGSGNMISVGSDAALTLKGEGSVGVIENYGALDFYDATALVIWTKGGTTNIYSGSVTATDGSWVAVNVSEGATVNIFGGTIYASGWRCVHANNSTVNISGGIFQSSVAPLTVENGGKIILSGGYFQRDKDHLGNYTFKDGYTMIDSNDLEKGAKMVCAVIDGVTLDPTTATLTVGGTQELTATVSPEIATFKTVTWTSSNEAVATVDENGVVTAVAAGTANITVTATNGTEDTSDDKTATCTITVEENQEEEPATDETKEEEPAPDETKEEETTPVTPATDTSIKTEVKTAEGTPAIKADNLDNALAEKLLTDAEKAEYANGTPVLVYLDVKEVDKANVPADDVKAIDKVTSESGYTYGDCLDISLWKKMGDGDATQVHDTNGNPIKMTVTVPASLVAPAGFTRTFRIVRVHGGEAKVLAEGTRMSLEISSDRFSSYFLVYRDTKIEEATNTSADTSSNTQSTPAPAQATSTVVPKTGEYMPIAALIMLILSMTGMVIVIIGLKKKNHI